MFCSKCGKTIPAGSDSCPGCGKAVGNARFAFSYITSAQSVIVPGQGEYEQVPTKEYTSTSYTSMSSREKESGEINSRTGYRPVYDGSAPENVRTGMRAAAEESRERVARRNEDVRKEIESALSEEDKNNTSLDDEIAETPDETVSAAPAREEAAESAEEETAPVKIERNKLSESTLEKMNELDASLQVEEEELDMSQFKARPIAARARAGISRDVTEYIRQIEDNQTRKSRRKAAENTEDITDDIEDIEEEPDTAADTEPTAESSKPAAKAKSDNAEEDLPEEPEDDFEEEPVRKRRIIKAKPEPEPENLDYDDDTMDEDFEDDHPAVIGTIVKILIAVVVVAALAFGIVRYVGYISNKSASAPIEGVSQSVYDSAIAMVDEHTTDEYKNNLLNDYNTNGVLSVSTALEADSAAITALLPSEPATNDETFLEAVKKIQDNIGSAILMDALSDGSDTANADSESRWAVVTNSIAQLKSATSAAELTAIINGETITVHNETPAPTEEPIVYTSLQKGDENNDVLQLQVRLYTLGYLTGDRDGAFGSDTQTAVKLFQQTAGLDQTGIADSDTQALLFSDDAPYAPGATTPTPAPEVTDTPEPTEAPAEEAPAEEAEDNSTAEGEAA